MKRPVAISAALMSFFLHPQPSVEAHAPAGTRAPHSYQMMPVHRLSPRVFPELPPAIARALEAGGFTVPQTWLYGEPRNSLARVPHNVVRGSFRSGGQVDWAVLGSRQGKSGIVVFWGGDPSDTTMLELSADEDWTQDVDGKGNLGYSRLIEVASPRRIRAKNPGMFRARDSELHDGIEEHFVEKASTILYFDGEKVLELEGAD